MVGAAGLGRKRARLGKTVRALQSTPRAIVLADEGVIKFDPRHRSQPLAREQCEPLARALGSWRRILYCTEILGCDPDRYGGAGFGNLSARLGPASAPCGRRPFLITGTQTGAKPRLSLADYCVVERCDYATNSVDSYGPILPSSESLTHGAIYDLSPRIQVVFHVHSPDIWRAAASLNLPTSDPAVAYGTPAMAEEVGRLYRDGTLSDRCVLAMAGHEDGIIAFGESAAAAGQRLISELASAYELTSAT
jgi:ribulose-5-phosphate 4-epimerase/fuculose-1-phosphate aldolase